jgi:hypothetical protein
MAFLLRLYGFPHEGLHLLALWLIGRRAVGWSDRHVDVPDDLTTGQYVFVAGLPALAFGGITSAGGVLLLNAPDAGGLLIGAALLAVGGFGLAGTVGDIQRIAARLLDNP